MKFILTKKDIIALNQEFDFGKLHNDTSLDFSLSYARKTENWTKALAYLTRAILIDHVFEEGNKRTAALLIKTYVEYEGYSSNEEKTFELIKKMLLKNIISINKIEDMIKNVIR